MANICYNYLTVGTHKQEEILSQILNDDNEVDFNILCPIPDDVTTLINPESSKEYRGERDWGWVNIGTPGAPDNTEVTTLDDDSVFITFDTQWSPPTKWFGVLCETANSINCDSSEDLHLELEYSEYDLEFAGRLEYLKQKLNDEYYNHTEYRGDQLAEALGLPKIEAKL